MCSSTSSHSPFVLLSLLSVHTCVVIERSGAYKTLYFTYTASIPGSRFVLQGVIVSKS